MIAGFLIADLKSQNRWDLGFNQQSKMINQQ